MDLALKGKRAFVSGGTAGIGFAIAELLLEEGATVCLASRSEKNVVAAVDQLRPQWGDKAVDGVVLDTESESSVRSAFAEATRRGAFDLLVNNTGGPAHGKPLSIALEDWDRGYQSLLRSVILLAQLATPAMRERRFGRMLTVTSTSAREQIPGLPVSSVFRTALTAWTKELAKEVGVDGILVNNILPGPIATARLGVLAKADPHLVSSMEKATALHRAAEPRELAQVAAFLLSPVNSYITGSDVLVDGGATRALH